MITGIIGLGGLSCTSGSLVAGVGGILAGKAINTIEAQNGNVEQEKELNRDYVERLRITGENEREILEKKEEYHDKNYKNYEANHEQIMKMKELTSFHEIKMIDLNNQIEKDVEAHKKYIRQLDNCHTLDLKKNDNEKEKEIKKLEINQEIGKKEIQEKALEEKDKREIQKIVDQIKLDKLIVEAQNIYKEMKINNDTLKINIKLEEKIKTLNNEKEQKLNELNNDIEQFKLNAENENKIENNRFTEELRRIENDREKNKDNHINHILEMKKEDNLLIRSKELDSKINEINNINQHNLNEIINEREKNKRLL